jgi:nuclear transport factor 2 (NTF2) superfamily protein
METKQKPLPTPPWDMENAAKRLLLEEAAWNTRNPEKILEGYTDNIEMQDGVDFIHGKAAFRQWLQNRFEKQLDYSVKLDLWGALKGRMAVRFEAKWRDPAGKWYTSYGVEVFQFNDDGYAERRFASQESTGL